MGDEADAKGSRVVEGEWRSVEKGEALDGRGFEPVGEVVLNEETAAGLAGEVFGEAAVVGVGEEILTVIFGGRNWFGLGGFMSEMVPIVEGDRVVGMGAVDGIGDEFLKFDQRAEDEPGEDDQEEGE